MKRCLVCFDDFKELTEWGECKHEFCNDCSFKVIGDCPLCRGHKYNYCNDDTNEIIAMICELTIQIFLLIGLLLLAFFIAFCFDQIFILIASVPRWVPFSFLR